MMYEKNSGALHIKHYSIQLSDFMSKWYGKICFIFVFFWQFPTICDKKQSKIKRPPEDKSAKHVFDTLGVDKTWLTILK